MTDEITKRDLKRDVEELKQRTETPPVGVFRTDDGRHYDKEGNRITDLTDVVFVIPPGVWKQWEGTQFSFNATEE